MNGILIAGGIGGVVSLVLLVLVLYYRRTRADLQLRVNITAAALSQREHELLGLSQQATKREERFRGALAEANKQISTLEALVDACVDPGVVRRRLNELGGMLSLLPETSRAPEDITRALEATRRPVSTGTTPDSPTVPGKRIR